MEVYMFQTIVLFIFMTVGDQLAIRKFADGFRRGVRREIWQSVTGKHVFNLSSSSEYQVTPLIDDILPLFDAKVNIGDNYGQRLTTFYKARESGAHVFYMTCQDECELWLSPDSRDEGKRRIIFVPYGLNLGQAEWDRNATQMSSTIKLVSGEFYFMQALMKAAVNSFDHLGVGVRRPSGITNSPIMNPDLFYEIPERQCSFFRLVKNDVALAGHVMYSRDTTRHMDCSSYCARDINCESYNFYQDQGICELNNKAIETQSVTAGLVSNKNVNYYEKLDSV